MLDRAVLDRAFFRTILENTKRSLSDDGKSAESEQRVKTIGPMISFFAEGTTPQEVFDALSLNEKEQLVKNVDSLRTILSNKLAGKHELLIMSEAKFIEEKSTGRQFKPTHK